MHIKHSKLGQTFPLTSGAIANAKKLTLCWVCSGVKSILKLYLGKSIVTDGKTRSKVESID